MIISESAKFVFLHNPKAAGTSVRAALKPWDTRNDFFWGIVFDGATGWNVDKAHLPVHVLSRLYPDVRDLLHRFVAFGFCRHPIARFISAYNESFPDAYLRLKSEELSVDEYASMLESYAQQLVTGGTWNPNFTHATPQKGIFYDGNKCVADLIIPIERPHPQVDALRSLLGSPGAAVADCFESVAARENARAMTDGPKDLLSPAVHRLLEDFYLEDFQLFGYSS